MTIKIESSHVMSNETALNGGKVVVKETPSIYSSLFCHLSFIQVKSLLNQVKFLSIQQDQLQIIKSFLSFLSATSSSSSDTTGRKVLRALFLVLRGAERELEPPEHTHEKNTQKPNKDERIAPTSRKGTSCNNRR